MKRALVVLLWFFAFWYAGSALARLIYTPDLIGPLFGIFAAALVFANPGGVIWREIRVRS